MKKTLAAVLAAAMALSTASVAMAKDTLIDEDFGNDNTVDVEGKIRYGKEVKQIITELGDFEEVELAQLYDEGKISVNVIMTQGANKLKSKPSITLRKRPDSSSSSSTQVTTARDVYTWNYDVHDAEGNIVFKKGSVLTSIPVYDYVNAGSAEPNSTDWMFIGDGIVPRGEIRYLKNNYTNKEFYENTRDWLVTNSPAAGDNWLTKSTNTLTENVTTTTSKGNKALQMKFTVADTYDTGSDIIGMKLRITIKKNFTSDVTGNKYTKGDTYTTEEFKYKAEYWELDQYNEDMQVTLQEVDDRYVKFDASDLYDEIGSDTFTISFEDTARFEAKLSASQKDVNLYYDVDEVTEVTDLYPEVDFEFITFRGKPSFVNSGTMTFNAIGGKKTQVYSYDGEALTPLPTDTADASRYDIVTVKGIKKLGTFVVASDILEEDEPDEPAEPVSSAPVVEGPEEDENPKTGAC